jgi:hypothetical protein
MTGGEIFGNSSNSGGGGVSSPNILKTGGTIYGYPASPVAKSNMAQNTDGTPKNNSGHAATCSGKHRESTAGPEVDLDSSVAGSDGGWE